MNIAFHTGGQSNLSQNTKRRDNLQRLLAPESIAFVGGTRAISAWRVCRNKGFTGRVYMVNPLVGEVDGVPTYPSLTELPEAPDATYIALDPQKTIAGVRTLAERGAGGVVVFGSGFSEVGPEGEKLERELVAAAGDVALVGPNCYGIINYISDGSLWPIDYPHQELDPKVAIISQSGNVAINLCQNKRGVPLTHVVSLGNQAGIQVHDLVEHFSSDPRIRAIGIYLDGLKEVGRFHDACIEALKRGVAVVVLKAGNSEISAEMAMSHTNSLAGSRDMYEALFDRTGVTWTRTIPEMLETLKLFSFWDDLSGDRVAFFSCSGGESSMAADFADDAGLTMVQPDENQIGKLKALLPAYGAISNPLDLTTALFGKGKELAQAVEVVMQGPSDTAVLIMDFAGDDLLPGSAPAQMIEGFAAACTATGKRAVIGAMKPESVSIGIQRRLFELGVLPMQGLETGCLAIAAGARMSARRQAVLDEAPATLLRSAGPGEARLLDEWESKSILASYGMPMPQGGLFSLSEVREAGARFEGSMVVKACSDRLPHKTEAGAVILNVQGTEAIAEAVERIHANVKAFDPSIAIDRFLIEEMVGNVVSELIVGLKNDPQFGPVLVIGTGGIFVELLKDAATLLLPTDRASIEQALRGLAGAPLFSGFRGRPEGDIDALVDAILGLARFAEANAEKIVEVDINPLFVLPRGCGVKAGDALVRMKA